VNVFAKTDSLKHWYISKNQCKLESDWAV